MPKPTLEDAIILATELHGGQVDKTGQPYILHCLRVMLNRSLTSDEERIAAVLHDVVEDCGITLENLRERGYSEGVIEAVGYITKLPTEEDNYDAFIERVLTGPITARKVKLADLRDNADLSRFVNPGAKDLARTEKYEKAIQKIEATL